MGTGQDVFARVPDIRATRIQVRGIGGFSRRLLNEVGNSHSSKEAISPKTWNYNFAFSLFLNDSGTSVIASCSLHRANFLPTILGVHFLIRANCQTRCLLTPNLLDSWVVVNCFSAVFITLSLYLLFDGCQV